MKSLKISDSPTPWGRQVRKPCRAAAEAGSPGGGILQGGEALRLLGPASGRCSPAGPPGVQEGRSETAFPGGIPPSPGEEAEEGNWAGCPARAACWGAEVRLGLVGRGGMEEAAWSGGQSHRDLRCEEEERNRGRKGEKNQVGEESQIETAEEEEQKKLT